MEKSLTKLQARNVFFGGSLFFFVVFVALVLHSHFYIVNTSTDSSTLNESVANPGCRSGSSTRKNRPDCRVPRQSD